MRARIDPRSLAALAATLIASAASVASMDMAAPSRTFTGTLPAQSVILAGTSPGVAVTVHAASTVATDGITLEIHLTASWEGFADGGADDGGAPDLPIVEAALHGVGEADGSVLDRAITMAPGTGALILSAKTTCAPLPAGCGADFTFTLDRIEQAPSGPVSVDWTAVASVASDAQPPFVTVEVTP